MSDQGGHGGASSSETAVPIVIMSSKPLAASLGKLYAVVEYFLCRPLLNDLKKDNEYGIFMLLVALMQNNRILDFNMEFVKVTIVL